MLLLLSQQTAILDLQRNQHKQRIEVNKKAQDGDAKDETPDTEKGVTKVSRPGQKETIKAQRTETINADAKTMADTYGMGMKKHMKKRLKKIELMFLLT